MGEAARKLDRYEAVSGEYRSSTEEIRPEYFVIVADRHTIDPPGGFNRYFDKKSYVIEFQKPAGSFGGNHHVCTSDDPHRDSSGVSGVQVYLQNFPEFGENTRNRFFRVTRPTY